MSKKKSAFALYYGLMAAAVLSLWIALLRKSGGASAAQIAAFACNALYWLTGETLLRTQTGAQQVSGEFTGAKGVNTSKLVGLGHAIAYIGSPLVALLASASDQQQSAGCSVCLLLLVVAPCTGGLLLRRSAMNTLGEYFTRQLRVQDKQEVISTGPYAFVRHPGYAANALTILPYVWVTCGHWLLATVLLAAWLAIVLVRIQVEEEMMLQASELGDAYKKYCASVKHRLVPGVY